jgi:hypothetical protein
LCFLGDASWHATIVVLAADITRVFHQAYYFLRKIYVLSLHALLLPWCLATSGANLLLLERRFISVEDCIVVSIDIVDSEVVVIRASQDLPGINQQLYMKTPNLYLLAITSEDALELVEDTVILV